MDKTEEQFQGFINVVSKPKITAIGDWARLGHTLKISEGFGFAVDIIEQNCIVNKNKLFFAGNGGSAAIALHQALDFFNNLNINTESFNDAAFLTCMANDYGFENIYARKILVIAQPGDVIAVISSSGKSENILKAAEAAKKNKCSIITMSGFDEDNPLREMGHVNFYVPSNSYRYVEASHSLYWDFILEMLIEKRKNKK